MTLTTELAAAARWIESVSGLSDPEKAEHWAQLMDALDDVRPAADGAKELAILHWREDVAERIRARAERKAA